VVLRAVIVGMATLFAYGLFEQWPKRLPGWIERWSLQLTAVVTEVPFAAYVAYWLTTGGDPQLPQNEARLLGYMSLCAVGMLFSTYMTLGAMVRQRDAFVRHQALAFQLERSELERKALDARLRLLQAQVEPHFLFNTLANVREMVVEGLPQAATVLDSLIAYLRAAVPRLHEPATTLGRELDLVRAYLELMQIRMPDRLQFTIEADKTALGLRCPPTTLLTLVENAVRHGIDPSEEGGRIELRVQLQDGRCRAQVIDTGVGLRRPGEGLGTGLATLRERLQLEFGDDARVSLAPLDPHGVRAEVEFRAQASPA
jgi:LytS/YehU family sensor histidine kinase